MRAQVRPRKSQVPSPRSGMRAPLASTNSIASAADLKFLQRLLQFLPGTSNRKAALEPLHLPVPLCFRSSYRECCKVLRTSEAKHRLYRPSDSSMKNFRNMARRAVSRTLQYELIGEAIVPWK